MLNDYKPTQDPNTDTFKVEYLLGFSALLAILFPQQYTISEILWTFSIWLESVAILPQLFMLQRTGEADTITTHYLFALGLYRALYIPNWIYRFFFEGFFHAIPVLAGIIQTVLYSDFFYIYYTNTQVDIDYSSESLHTPKDTALETESSRLPSTSKEMMLPHPGDCRDDDDDDGKEKVTMPFHYDARLGTNMLPILDFPYLNSRMTRKKKSFVGIRHTLPSEELVVHAYMLTVTVVVALC
ncbi:ER lumen protein retaining receptor [Penicillium occitanis (nom. inval.)]|nr:ER lumen protein retaining receptor [Penicillium occitanis (nom. inval.)]PCG89140.1 hypothetical protein PENOC_107830 [Penicillium occitanis (nom. inval.)]